MTSDTDRLWIKICGIRDVETAVRVAELDADAVGINFYDRSPRSVADLATAAAVVSALPEATTAVGVFVNHTAAEIRQICEATGLSVIQLHGDEPDSLLAELADDRVIRAFRIDGPFIDQAADHLSRYADLGAAPAAWLLDARVAGAYGGTGHTIDWTGLSPEHRIGWPPLILAGGLTPDNVADAVATVRPWGVDVASGVESSPGIKDLALVERFIFSARERRS